jgi:predicted permease
MQLNYLSLLQSIAPVFALFAGGYAIRRARWLTAEADRSVLRLTVNFFYPALIFDTLLSNSAFADRRNLVLPPLLGFGMVAVALLLALGWAHVIRLRDERQRRTFAFTAGLQNYGYIAIPIVQTFFDRNTVAVLFAHNLGVEIAFWTAGIFVVSAGSARMGWRNLLNAPVVAIIVSIALNFAGGRGWIPSFVMTTAHLTGQCAVPMGVLLSGATLADLLAQTRPRGGLLVVAGSCAFRLGLMPVLFLAAAFFLPCSTELKRVLVVQGAMPAAMLPIVIAKHYDGDEQIALQVVLTTTLLGLFTIPLWIQIGLRLLGG